MSNLSAQSPEFPQNHTSLNISLPATLDLFRFFFFLISFHSRHLFWSLRSRIEKGMTSFFPLVTKTAGNDLQVPLKKKKKKKMGYATDTTNANLGDVSVVLQKHPCDRADIDP